MIQEARTELFAGKVILAPLTRGGNLPFRQLCVELGAEVTMGEMALAHKLIKGSRSEHALLRRAPQEEIFGAQIAGRKGEVLADAARMAEDAGADFVDLNLGCPIDLLCRRGLGAALLKKPGRVGALVEAMVRAVSIPVTVKMRMGYDDQRPRYREVALAAQEAGAAAVTLHGRSRKQRYRRAADWEVVADLASRLEIPVIGNGDLLTHEEISGRWRQSGCASVMVGRGALVKPWIFLEAKLGRDILLDEEARLQLLRRYVRLAREHFGEDERGERRVRDFLLFHLEFFSRYRAQEAEPFASSATPRLQQRQDRPEGVSGIHALLYENDEASQARLVDLLLGKDAPPPDHAAAVLPEGAVSG